LLCHGLEKGSAPAGTRTRAHGLGIVQPLFWPVSARPREYSSVPCHRGEAYRNLGQYQRAIQDCDEAIHLDPQHCEAYNNRGLAYNNLGQYERAIQDFDEVIRLDPQLAIVYSNRGEVYQSLGNRELAGRDFQKAMELGFTPPDGPSTNGLKSTVTIIGGIIVAGVVLLMIINNYVN
jgi:tetratricopeptide (TPR) repeat protein